MKLLIITQKVDIEDDNLGFFHRWLEKFAEKVERLYVICLWEGKHSLPENVKVYSLGKEKGYSKLRQFFRFQKFLFRHIREANGVFVHMCPIYAVLAWPLAKIFGKKIILWYIHKSVNWKLKLAKRFVNKILTASPESCQLKNRKKIEIVGHGIDTKLFKPLSLNSKPSNSDIFKILFVGRISPIKDLETLIKAIDILVNQKNIQNIAVKIIGKPSLEAGKEYFKKLKTLIEEKRLKEYIQFLGTIPHQKIVSFYQKSDVLVNLSPTGGIDKAVLEAMACGTLVLVCNQSFKKDFGQYSDKLIFQEKNPSDLALKIINLRDAKKDTSLREIVIKHHNLGNLINKIIKFYE